MSETFLDGKIELHCGDCLDLLAAMPENSVDSICCDPPYALVSIVNRFGKVNQSDDTKTSERSRNGADGYARLAKGFMSKSWDNGKVSFSPEVWFVSARILKPGGHLVAFGGDRTFHRLYCAIEDGGFEPRHTILWLYGSGFPKSHNVGKALSKIEWCECDD